MLIKQGDKFWSNYFNAYGIVIRYIDDNNWWFRLDGKKETLKAQSTPDKLKWVK